MMLTPRMSQASTTRVQSRSINLNADHGICLLMRLSRRSVVNGPYISLADARNNAIGCSHLLVSTRNNENIVRILAWQSLCDCSSILYAVPHRMLQCNGIFKASSSPQCSWVLSKYSMRCPDAWMLSQKGNK